MPLLQRAIKPAAKRQITWLLGVVILVAVLAFPVFGLVPSLAVLYGGCIVLSSTGVLIWRMCRPPEHAGAHKQLGQFYRTSLERLVLVCVLISAGLGPLGLPPIFLLGGFLIGVVAQAAITVLIWKRVI